MDVNVDPLEDQTKSAESTAPAPKTASSASAATPKRKRIIDEDEDEAWTPMSVASAPKPVISAPAKVEAKSAASASVKKELSEDLEDEERVPASRKSSVKAEVKDETDDGDKETTRATKAGVKKSASAPSNRSDSAKKSSSSKGTPKKVKKEAEDSDSDGDFDEPAPKRKKAADGEKVAVKASGSTKANGTVVKKASSSANAPGKDTDTKPSAKATKATKAKGETKPKAKGKASSIKDTVDDESTSGQAPPASATTSEERFKWWEAEASKVMKKHPEWKWASLQHSGVIFPPPYKPHGVKMLYDGKPVTLSPEAEEAATFFAKHVGGPHYEKPVFRKNFFADFLEIVHATCGKSHVIQKFNLCDFSPITAYLKEQAELKKSRSKEEKEAEKQQKLELKKKYGYAIVNGNREPVGNFTVEPPGLFLGRGEHPKAGMIKKRITPKDIMLNLSRDAEVPPCPIPGASWGQIVHNHSVGWIAGWMEEITGHNKYVQFAAASSIKGASDRKKYEKARRLKDHISAIRKDYLHGLKSKDLAIQQRSTAMWIIDRLALRVGNEKSEDEADTVGCCSLRVEHIKLIPPRTLEFDFLGKDSMRYYKEVAVPQEIYDNIKKFQQGKRQSEDIFDQLTTTNLNSHLKSLMEGLTAKVFRTYNASVTLQQQLAKFSEEFGGEPGEVDVKEAALRLFYNRANREVAILCNHQKTVSKSHANVLANLDNQIAETKDLIDTLKKHLKDLKAGKVPVKANPKKRTRDDAEDEEKEEKEIKLPTNPESTQKKIDAAQKKLEKLEADKIDKGEGAQIQNSTSKINYMDPRITIAFCMKTGLPLKQVFTATLIEKFAWAIAEVEDDNDFEF